LKESVSALIAATISHRLPEVFPERLNASEIAAFLDLDMGILADSPSVYEKYSQQISEEYSHYPTEAYRLGRSKVLQGFLLHERIFLGPDTEAMEQKARENIQSEINRLAMQST
jgi:predicted metal-dependent HD superfamily phosphohydrolase